MEDFISSLTDRRNLEDWIIALGFALGGYVLGKIVAWLSKNVLRRISARTKTRLDDILLVFIEKPLVFIITIGGVGIGAHSLSLPEGLSTWIDKVYMILVTGAVAWAIARVIDAFIQEYLVPYVERSEGTFDDQALPILRKGLKVLVWGMAILIALKNTGYDVGALLTGLGIGGAAIALAAKDTLSNFFGSVAVFIDRPFKINDRIKIAGVDGTVEEIGIRTSRLRTLDNRLVTIPNATFATSPIENVSSEPSTKITATIDLATTAGSEGARKAVEAAKAALAGLADLDEGSLVGISGFTDFGIRMTYVYFIKKGSPYLDTLNAANLAVLSAVEAQGLSLAAPARVALEKLK